MDGYLDAFYLTPPTDSFSYLGGPGSYRDLPAKRYYFRGEIEGYNISCYLHLNIIAGICYHYTVGRNHAINSTIEWCF